MAPHVPLALFLAGVVLAAIGAALVYPPAGLILAGVVLGAFGVLLEWDRQASEAPAGGDS